MNANKTVSSQYMRTNEIERFLGVHKVFVLRNFNVQSWDYSKGGNPCGLYNRSEIMNFDAKYHYHDNINRLTANEVSKLTGLHISKIYKLLTPTDEVTRKDGRTYRYYSVEDLEDQLIKLNLYYQYAKIGIINRLKTKISKAELILKDQSRTLVPELYEYLEYMRNY